MLSERDVLDYLNHPETWDELFDAARTMRGEHFGNQVFAYGFDYFSTHCRNQCAFCLYRAGNCMAPRYRHGTEDVVRSALHLAQSGVHLIDLTMGEDPYYLRQPDRLVHLVRRVSEATQLPIMVSPGVVPSATLGALRDAGATWFALYQETFDKRHFARLRVGQSFDERMELKRQAVEEGLLVEEGILTGWGDTNNELAHALVHVGDVAPAQVRVMTFVPQPGTPLADRRAQGNGRELAAIALLRIMYPDLLIPASLDVEGPAGLRARLDAGANVVTSIIPPDAGLLGVARNSDIEDEGRSLAQVLPTVLDAGLELAKSEDYLSYLRSALDGGVAHRGAA